MGMSIPPCLCSCPFTWQYSRRLMCPKPGKAQWSRGGSGMAWAPNQVAITTRDRWRWKQFVGAQGACGESCWSFESTYIILSYMYINTIIHRCTILYNPRSLYSHYNIMILTGNKYSTVLCHWMELSPTVARKGAVRSGRTSYPCFRSHRPIPVETQASKERTFGLAGLKRSPCHVPPKQVTCYCVIITQERGESFQNEQLWKLSLCDRV